MKGKTRKISSLVVCLAMIATVFAVAGNVNAETGCVVPPSGMVSWWPGDGNADDIVGGLNGIPIDGVAFVLGKVDQAFAFNKPNYVSVPDDPILTLGDRAFTIDLWVNFNRIQGRDPFIGHDESGGEYNKWVFLYDDCGHEKPSGPALRFHINSPTLRPLDPVIAPWNPTIGQWYHVAVTRSDNTYALYIDGVQVATDTDDNTIPDPNAPLTIGRAESLFFDGLIDEVEIFNRALSTSEIQTIFNAGSKGKCKGVCATIDIEPDTLNLQGHGEWITCYIELPEGYDVADIDVSTILLEDEIPAEAHPTGIGDCDDDGIVDRMVKFDRSVVQGILEVGEEVEITVAGELTGGTPFEGSDTIRVIDKGRGK